MVSSDNGVALPYLLIFKILESVKECNYTFSIAVIGAIIWNDCVKEITFSWKECYLEAGICYQQFSGTYFDDTATED